MSIQIAQATVPAPANPFGNTGIQPVSPRFAVTPGGSANDQALSNMEAFISQMIGVLTVVSSLFFVIYFVMGAFKWVTAGGEASKIQKARDQMIQGVTGLIIIVGAYGIIGLVGTILGIDILQPAKQLQLIIP